jgi:DNA-binding NarL/FixJ family response regulator
MRRGVRSLLRARPDVYVCAEAVDGQDAVERALKCQPDLIILDLTMPVMGGFEAARALRKILPEVPILFYSIHQGKQVIRDAQELGVQGFVCKTDISDMLLDAIEAIVDHKTTFFPDSSKGAGLLV